MRGFYNRASIFSCVSWHMSLNSLCLLFCIPRTYSPLSVQTFSETNQCFIPVVLNYLYWFKDNDELSTFSSWAWLLSSCQGWRLPCFTSRMLPSTYCSILTPKSVKNFHLIYNSNCLKKIDETSILLILF